MKMDIQMTAEEGMLRPWDVEYGDQDLFICQPATNGSDMVETLRQTHQATPRCSGSNTPHVSPKIILVFANVGVLFPYAQILKEQKIIQICLQELPPGLLPSRRMLPQT